MNYTLEPGYGKFTNNLEENIHVGDFIKMDGPLGKLRYLGYGSFTYMNQQILKKTNIGMLAAGTGITPIFSIA